MHTNSTAGKVTMRGAHLGVEQKTVKKEQQKKTNKKCRRQKQRGQEKKIIYLYGNNTKTINML